MIILPRGLIIPRKDAQKFLYSHNYTAYPADYEQSRLRLALQLVVGRVGRFTIGPFRGHVGYIIRANSKKVYDLLLPWFENGALLTFIDVKDPDYPKDIGFPFKYVFINIEYNRVTI